jgi:hypothetical protein
MPRYIWDTAKVGVKHQSMNQLKIDIISIINYQVKMWI